MSAFCFSNTRCELVIAATNTLTAGCCTYWTNRAYAADIFAIDLNSCGREVLDSFF